MAENPYRSSRWVSATGGHRTNSKRKKETGGGNIVVAYRLMRTTERQYEGKGRNNHY